MIDERYEKLSVGDKEVFARVLNKLLRVNYIVRDVYSVKEKEMKINYDYKFLERNMLLYEDYLVMGGWQFHRDDRFGVIYVTSSYDYNRRRLKKFPTLVLLTLRLIYDEEREKLTLKREVALTVHSLIQKMISLGIINKKPSKTELSDTLTEIAGYQIIQKLDGGYSDPDTRFMIYPSILFLLTNSKINDLYQLIHSDNEGQENVMNQVVMDGGLEDENIY